MIKNTTGKKIIELRENNHLSQRELAKELKIKGLNIDKNVITRIETGRRFVTDFEVKVFSEIFYVTADYLLEEEEGRKTSIK